MDFRQLRYFMEIARQGSLTKASEKLGITQPPLGYHVRRLEDELQLSLLVRGSRGVRLTPGGRILFEEGAVIVKSLGTLREACVDPAHKCWLIVFQELASHKVVSGAFTALIDRNFAADKVTATDRNGISCNGGLGIHDRLPTF